VSLGPVSLESVALIFFAILAGGLAKGVTGFGLPLIAVPVLASFLGVERAVVIMVIPGFVSNVALMWEHRSRAGEARGLAPFLAAGVIGAVGGTWVLKALSAQVLALVLAGWIGLYLLTRLTHPDLKVADRVQRPLAPVIGFVAGCSQGATGASGQVVGTWFHALRLEPAVYVFSVCAIFATFSVVQMVSMASFGLFTEERVLESVIAVVPAMIGVPLGVRLGRVIARGTFDRIILGVLMILEARLIWQGIGA
jgi:uncharacterized protein